jgi:hypothetical protein
MKPKIATGLLALIALLLVPATTHAQISSPLVKDLGSEETVRVAEGLTQEATVNDFLFVLKECVRSGTTIKCELSITNNIEDRVLYLYTYSRIIDTEGNQYTASVVELGGVKGGVYVEQKLVQGIPLKGYVTFDNIPAQFNQLALLEISCYYFVVQFRDVSVSS